MNPADDDELGPVIDHLLFSEQVAITKDSADLNLVVTEVRVYRFETWTSEQEEYGVKIHFSPDNYPPQMMVVHGR